MRAFCRKKKLLEIKIFTNPYQFLAENKPEAWQQTVVTFINMLKTLLQYWPQDSTLGEYKTS